MPDVVFAESALNDLDEILAWYADQGVPKVGRRFVGEVFERVEALSGHAEIGRIVPEFGLPQVRELIHPPFRIVYRYDCRQTPDEVQVIRVWRSERLLRIGTEHD